MSGITYTPDMLARISHSGFARSSLLLGMTLWVWLLLQPCCEAIAAEHGAPHTAVDIHGDTHGSAHNNTSSDPSPADICIDKSDLDTLTGYIPALPKPLPPKFSAIPAGTIGSGNPVQPLFHGLSPPQKYHSPISKQSLYLLTQRFLI